MTSFLRTRKDRHPKHDKPRLPHEHDQSFDRQDPADSGRKVERPEIRQAYDDIREGKVDTDLRGSGGLDEMNKAPGRVAADAPRKK
ncbi:MULTISPECIES: hypothetical protein [unclassified Herbaspirillum]|uniref:hypothetical protein n=1 Tax=unclassified Herbaspirillum TaxID=2624150 RepID=UPI00114E1C03|nr:MULTISPECIES: hypothetical protein [unclassified Herbaspirillum]MBB5389892.1 hypothetical protein [Herbaspirillum sp. SJZ102]TQK09595.1 hypothetical protein FB599_1967 [Herbaspirillum sp. SJZ130]TQK13718.1 hypothetical protein FB598_1075 [Herbaspirillum sp. SJZ106]TWC69435.1 hypothetical protein FB597_10238 [Herbaspirillum sp. SJZ099]